MGMLLHRRNVEAKMVEEPKKADVVKEEEPKKTTKKAKA